MGAFTINGERRNTIAPLKALFEFISDFRNFRVLLPSDKVENFKADKDSCSFNIRGVTPLSIEFEEKVPYSRIRYRTTGLAKFNFALVVDFNGAPDQTGICHVSLEGNLNPFIKAMAEKPLKNLVDTMTSKLASLQP